MKLLNYVFVLLSVVFLASVSSCSSEGSSSGANTLETGWYYIAKEGADLVERIKVNTKDTFFLNPIPAVDVSHFKEMVIYSGMVGNEGLQVVLNEEGTKLWADATKAYARNYMGFVIDNELIHVQRIATQNLYGTTTLNEKWFDKKFLEETAAKVNLQIPKDQK